MGRPLITVWREISPVVSHLCGGSGAPFMHASTAATGHVCSHVLVWPIQIVVPLPICLGFGPCDEKVHALSGPADVSA